MRNLILILGEQLNQNASALQDFDFERDQVIMIESFRKAARRRWHKHKLIATWTAMREFASELIGKGYNVFYISADYSRKKSLRELVSVHYYQHDFQKVIVMEPTSKAVSHHLEELGKLIPLELRPNNLFLYSTQELSDLPKDFTDFYIYTRKKFQILTEGNTPVGDRWMFKHTKRKTDSKSQLPKLPPNDNAIMVGKYVEKHFPKHPGQASDFSAPVTRADALALLAQIFGGTEIQLNAGLSVVLNLGLLLPGEVIERIKQHAADFPPEKIENFTRKIILREFLRLKYLHPDGQAIQLDSPRKGAGVVFDRDMFCIDQTLLEVSATGYSPAFNRHKILQNLMLLLEFDPATVRDWFELNFIDSVDWLIEPNLEYDLQTLVVNAANTINLSTSFCKSCQFDPKVTIGPNACPYNFLYWQFLYKYQDQLHHLPHLKVHYKRLNAMDGSELTLIQSQAAAFLDKLKLTRKGKAVNASETT